MEAPDKIYVPQHNIEAGNIQELNELIVEGSTEYIRKDALLEWAKERKHYFADRQKFDGGWNALLDELIDKLNSL